jgi:probable rRNA maturation factor
VKTAPRPNKGGGQGAAALPLPKLHCPASWSPAAARSLADLEATKRDLNSVVRSAARQALSTSPRYKPLIDHLTEASPSELAYSLDVSWLSDEEMHEVNLEHRGKDKPTDVLSFPLWEGEVFAVEAGESIALGDLVISIDTAVRQAQELKHSLREEVAFLTIHGVLHLLGFDHQTDAQRRQMWRQQDALFEAFQTRLKAKRGAAKPTL